MHRPRLRILATLALLAAGSTAALAAPAALEVRFYPDRALRLHEENGQRGVWNALVQNVAVINRGETPVTLDRLTFELAAGTELAQSHPIAGETLAALAARSGRIAGSGLLQLFPGQFRPETLFAGAEPVGSSTLAPGEALLVGHRVFTVQSAAIDRLRLVAHGAGAAGAVEARAELPLVRAGSANRYRFPLEGAWFVGIAATLHGHHRWAVPEEFALDIARLGDAGHSYKTTGATNADHYAWDAPVRAAADGKVVAVVDRFPDSEESLRRPGESAEAFAVRTLQTQTKLLQQGLDAIGGNLVTIEHAHGEYSHSAHLRAGSVLVKVGDLVKAGQPIGRLGNSGNSTEPHLHFQVTDGPAALDSAGIPIEFDGIEILWADAPRALQNGDVVRAD